MGFVLDLLCEVMSGLLFWQAVQALQRRMAVLKASHLSEELGRLISHSLRVCSRACAGNQADSVEGIHLKITSKGWACQCQPPVGKWSFSEGDTLPGLEFRRVWADCQRIYSNPWALSRWHKSSPDIHLKDKDLVDAHRNVKALPLTELLEKRWGCSPA